MVNPVDRWIDDEVPIRSAVPSALKAASRSSLAYGETGIDSALEKILLLLRSPLKELFN